MITWSTSNNRSKFKVDSKVWTFEYSKNNLQGNFLMNVITTLGHFYTKRSLESKNRSNLNSHLYGHVILSQLYRNRNKVLFLSVYDTHICFSNLKFFAKLSTVIRYCNSQKTHKQKLAEILIVHLVDDDPIMYKIKKTCLKSILSYRTVL